MHVDFFFFFVFVFVFSHSQSTVWFVRLSVKPPVKKLHILREEEKKQTNNRNQCWNVACFFFVLTKLTIVGRCANAYSFIPMLIPCAWAYLYKRILHHPSTENITNNILFFINLINSQISFLIFICKQQLSWKRNAKETLSSKIELRNLIGFNNHINER